MGVALRPLLAEYKETPGWEELGGVAAIDAFNALYQFLSGIRQADGAPLMDGEGRTTSHLNGLLFRNANLIEKNITPVYVFDGKPPAFKSSTLAKRQEIRKHAADSWEKALKKGDEESARKYAMASSKVDAFVISSSKELLSALGIAWIQAPEEGEAQSSYMARQGDVTYAVSQDYDSLLFGAPDLVRNITVSGKKRFRGKVLSVYPERLNMETILAGLSVTQEELIQTALLIGTDYNSGVTGVGPKTAIKIVKEGKFYDRIGESENAADPGRLIEYFLNPPVETSYKIESRPPDPNRVIDLLCEKHGFTQERVEAGLERISAKKGQATLDAWF